VASCEGNKMKHAELLFYEYQRECDMCDSRDNVTAIIDSLCGDTSCICVECLSKIIRDAPNKIELDSISKS
jgi:phosphoribulokinase